ncbi:MAG: L-aspartate oxidase [Beijerinckiaceae bacterium]|nr:L-aspartate oxidase [Beijerinckiaceae bacterium]
MDRIDAGRSCVIIGGGLAGLTAALSLAPRPVILLSKAPLGFEAASSLAQGGIAACLGPDDDVVLHLADTLAAGDGLCNEPAARAILAAAPFAIEELVRRGVNFDRDSKGKIALGLEAAHSRRRIVHAGGDSTGRQIMRALTRLVRKTPSITIMEGAAARRLLVDDNRLKGVLAERSGGFAVLETGCAVIATGGIGGLFEYGTNPAGSWGQGLALAATAGARMADLEFVQFHPTALDSAAFPLKLVSETVRGEGAVLIDERGTRFMAGEPGAELAPRDIVARAVWRQMAAGHRVYLDARRLPDLDFPRRFPAITSFCHAAGIDPVSQPIPVRPAAHYHMGGIAVDLAGRTSIEGLWACGEAACTGLHGANRLASNSLLEAAVCGHFVAESIKGTAASPRRGKTLSAVYAGGAGDPAPVRKILSRAAGVLRGGHGLEEAAAKLLPLALDEGSANDAAKVALMIVIAALRRQESRGAHARTDFPDQAPQARRTQLNLEEAIAAAREIALEPAA